jgi:signal transduction histidine kinase/ActR/RegA family two-component response regulator
MSISIALIVGFLLILLSAAMLWAWGLRQRLRWQERENDTKRRNKELARRMVDADRAAAESKDQVQAVEAKLAEAVRANLKKNDFVAQLSHEIRNPLAGVLGMTDQVLETNLTVDQREALTTARECAASLMSLLNDVLDLSRMDAERLELARVRFSLRDSLDRSLRAFKAETQAKGLALQWNVATDVTDARLGDPERLRQVLVNLVGNAVKFTESGAVRVTVERDQDDVGGQRLVFVVADTGIGIPASRQQVIFEPFLQANVETTRQYGGSGLGLAICARLVGLMGGRIAVESEPGKGSTFLFDAHLELADAVPSDDLVAMSRMLRTPEGLGSVPENEESLIEQALSGQSLSAPSLAEKKLHVLVVEDNAVNQKVARRLLEKRGHRVSLAMSGTEALAKMRTEEFDVVLMDVQMPDMDGVTTTTLLREEESRTGARRHPVIALTGSALDEDRRRCLEAGMDGFLTKPVDATQLTGTVESAAAANA